MKSTSLYNLDGSLSPEAQQLLSHRPDGVSIADWRKTLKKFRDQLSPEDLKEFERLRNNKRYAKRRAENPEKVSAERAKWRAENPEKVSADSAKWYAENTEKAKQNSAKWYAENTERAKENNANWYANNSEKAKENNANWRAENPEHVASYINDYHKQRKAKDPLYRLQTNMRNACTRVVKQLSIGKKPVSTFKWIGCSPEELKARLESLFTEGMTWENYGEWHVDHIRPICSFTAEEWEQVNHYTNLRPLWAEDNIAKSVFDKLLKVKKETPAQEESPSVVMN